MSEIELLRTLSEDPHSGIGRVYDVYEDFSASNVTIVMECIEGGYLQNWILNPENEMKSFAILEMESKKLFYKLMDALNLHHTNGIVHRDLKLENIIILHDKITNEYSPKIVDIGLSAVLL